MHELNSTTRTMRTVTPPKVPPSSAVGGLALFLLLTIAGNQIASAQALLREPYLQSLTNSAVTIVWQTDDTSSNNRTANPIPTDTTPSRKKARPNRPTVNQRVE